MVFIYDLEVFPNFHSCCVMNRDTQEIRTFVIHESKNEINEYLGFLNYTITGGIGFNNLRYDYPIIHFILKNKKRYQSLEATLITAELYQESQRLIGIEFPEINTKNIKIPQLDLFRVWHFDNKAKMTSLKDLEIAMHYPVVQDLPFKYDQPITADQIDIIVKYGENDVRATYEFYKITIGQTENPLYKGVDKIQLRKDIIAQFGIPCISYNDVKIGDEINKLNYLKAINQDKDYLKTIRTVRDSINVSDCIPSFIKFDSPQLTGFLERLKKIKIVSTKGDFKEEVIYRGIRFKFGQGGLHSHDPARKIIPKQDEVLEDRDCASMYPTWIINQKLYPSHLGLEWLNGYIWTRDERIKAKGLFKTTKESKYQAIQEAYKLALNGGGFGKTGQPTSWQSDPLVTQHTTIGNQLCLMMLCERYMDKGVNVISANTDGVLIIKKLNQFKLVEEIDKWWEEITQHTLEYTPYKMFVQTTVNDYLAIKMDGEPKFKGDFDPFKEMHKDHSFRIVPLALHEFFVNGVPIQEFIKTPNYEVNLKVGKDIIKYKTNIYDYCGRHKSTHGWHSELRYINSDVTGNPYLQVDKLQKTNRYFISTDGASYLKVHSDGREQWINKGTKSTLFNNYYELPIKDYGIDYDFYIKSANRIINEVLPKQMSLF